MDAVKAEQAGESTVLMPGPLSGLRVLDLGTRIAAPFCAGLLGEQGAEVIKIEQPGTGDFMREIGPFTDDGYSLFWAVEGRGRRSVTLNLRTPRGQELFRSLAATADVVVENFRPGTLERWNIAPGDLDPRLVTVRISTFGQDGPYSERPGLDRVGIGYGGLLHLTGYPDRPPVRVGVTISDYLTGVFAAQAATAALYGRDARGGQGAVVDAALYGAVLRILEWTIAAYDRLGIVRSREGNRLANSAPLDNYPTADGKYVCIVAGSDANFAAAVRGDGPARPPGRSAVHPPRRPRRPQRRDQRHRRGVDRRRATATDVEAACVAHDVPVATAFTAADMFADAQFAARGDLMADRRSRHRTGPPAGAVPALRRRAGSGAHRRPDPRRRHRRRARRPRPRSPTRSPTLRADGVV